MAHERSIRRRRLESIAAVVALSLVVGLMSSQTTSATIVWSKGGDIWAMNDDGSGQRLLIPKSAAPGMDALRSPAVSPSGSAVFFTGETARNKVTRTGVCGVFPFTYPCITTHYGFYSSGTYRWNAGTTQRLSPEPSYCFNCTDGTNEPEPRADGSYVASFMHCQGFLDTDYDCVGSIVSSDGAGYPAVCNGETLSGDLPSGPSPNPAAPGTLVYAGCGAGGQPSALIVTGPNNGGERIVACDDATQADPSWSPSGDQIVAAEGGGEAGLWVYGGANSGCFSSPLREAVSAPAEVSFSSPRFVGSDRIVFAAQGELWAVAASCTACAFPAAATKLTSGGDNSSPSWTTDPLVVPPAPAADKKAPKLSFKLKKRQRIFGQGGKIVLKIRADEACRLTIRTKIVLPGKDLGLKKATRSLKAGKLTTIKLQLSRKALKAIERAWRKGVAPTAKLSIAAKDAGGNTARKTQRVSLVP